jgi:type IV secretion system protein VirD4
MELFLGLQRYYWYVYGGGCALMLVLIVIRVVGNRRRRQGSTSHGSARWATVREVRRAGLFAKDGVLLGAFAGEYLRDDSETHLLLVGPTRSGKGLLLNCTALSWMATHAATEGKSLVMFDPKDGENYDISGRWRRGPGGKHPVYAFAPCQEVSARVNVLDTVRLRTRREFADAQVIAQSLVAPEKMVRESQTSLHFRELAGMLLTAAILHVLYTSNRKSLAGVWEFLTVRQNSLNDALKAMSSTRHLSQGVHSAIASLTRAIKNITGDRELSSVWSTAIRPLVLYNDPLIAAATDASDFDLNDLQYGPRPASLYLIAPSTRELERLHPLYRVVLDVLLKQLMEHKVRTWRHRLLVCADELPAYGYTHAVEKGIAEAAGYGIKAFLVCQDLEQLWDVYGAHSAIWGNCKTKIFFAPDNDLTAKRISQNLLGESTVEQPVVHQGGSGLQANASTTYQFHGRPLLTPDELMELDPSLEIIRVSGVKPILAHKLDYRSDVNLRRRVLR